MKKVILRLSVLAIFSMWSCNNNPANTHNGSENAKNAEITTPKSTNSADTLAMQKGNIAETYAWQKLNFRGTEPFWNIAFQNDYAIYTSPEELEGVKIFYKKNVDDNNNVKLTEAVVKISDKEYKLQGLMAKTKIAISIKKEPCNDGMSDEKGEFKMILIKGKTSLDGCGFEIKQ